MTQGSGFLFQPVLQGDVVARAKDIPEDFLPFLSLGFSVYSSILCAYSEFYLFPSSLGTFPFSFIIAVVRVSSLLC